MTCNLRKTWGRLVGLSVLVIAGMALSGCGGGGGGSSTPTPTPYLLGGSIQGVALNLTGTGSIYAGPTGAKYTEAFSPNLYDITTDGTYLYVLDEGNSQIEQINIANGTSVSLANSQFLHAIGMTTGDEGKKLFVAGGSGNDILQIDISASDFASSTVSILAGDGNAAELDGTGTAAEFNEPSDITTDGTYLYVTDAYGKTVRRVTISSGLVTTIVPARAGLLSPRQIVVVGTGASETLYLTDTAADVVLNIQNPTSTDISKITMSTFCGSKGTKGILSGSCSGTAEFSGPFGLTTDGAYLYVEDDGPFAIQQINIATRQVVRILIGYGTSSQTQFQNSSMTGLTTDGVSLYGADEGYGDVVQVQ